MAKQHYVDTVKWMVIDMTSIEHTAVIKVAHIKEAALWGHLYKAQGRQVTVREVYGHSFTLLSYAQLQYLYWNLTQQTPPEDEVALVLGCLAAVEKLPVAETTVAALETELEAIRPDTASSKPRAPKDPNAPVGVPKATSTCGVVWAVCEKYFALANNQIPDRKTVIDECVNVENINSATASTQWAKWKKSKEVPAST